MYQFSRSIYRELAPRVEGDEIARARARHHLLAASEGTVERLAEDGRYFARPVRTLFNEIRDHFPLAEQVHVHMVVDRYVRLAVEFIEANPELRPRRCPASTRNGNPCQREPREGHEYCPSHMHLEEPLETSTVRAA